MSYKLRIFFVLIVTLCTPRMSAGTLSTHNNFVTASVEDGSGLISFFKGTSLQIPPSINLSFRDKSFLSVKVGAKVYSNNNVTVGPPNGMAPDMMLDNGVNTKIGDTIETVWQETGFDIVQDVYPVAFEVSGQIVYKIRIVNHTGAALAVQAQYLLDVDVSGSDGAKILTRYNYTPNWTLYPNDQHGIPWFFMGFENPPTTANPGYVSTGYVNDTLAPEPLGLLQPDTFAVVDWMRESDFAWGLDPISPWSSAYNDNAIFTQWPLTAAAANGKDTTVEIARGSYGTGEFEICYGNLLAITFYPHRIKYDWRKNQYTPNPFVVESMIFNTSNTNDATRARASVTTSSMYAYGPGPLRIVAPSGVTTNSDSSFKQIQDIGSGIVSGKGGTIPQLDVAEVSWVDSTVRIVKCTGDSAASLTLSVTMTGIQSPAFVTPCEMPIVIECTNTDSLAPKVLAANSTSFDSLFIATDTTAIDYGIQSVSWTISPTFDSSNFPVTLSWAPTRTSSTSPTNLNCLKDPVAIHITQKDSTVGGCVNLVVTDCNGNSTFKEVCFQGPPISIHRDTLPPQFFLDAQSNRNSNPDMSCNATFSRWTVSEIRLNDEGLSSIAVVPGSGRNMVFQLTSKVVPGDRTAEFQVSVLDSTQDGSIIISATDSVEPHNVAYDTVRYCAAPFGAVQPFTSTPPLEISVHPNPSAGIFSISLSEPSTNANVEVLDILGHRVDSFRLDRTYDWDAGRLSSGTYIVRVTIGSGTISKRIIKE